MATFTTDCTVNNMAVAYSYAAYYDYLSVGSSQIYYCGMNGASYVFCMQFTIPYFAGISNEIEFSLSVSRSSSDGAQLRYALCTSDANIDSYRNTYSRVDDANQIASGIISKLSSSYVGRLNITLTDVNLTENTTYYLILWNGYAQGEYAYVVFTDSLASHIVTISCRGAYDSSVFVENGTIQGLASVYDTAPPVYSTDGSLIALHNNHVAIIKFSTPDFHGVSSRASITMTLTEYSSDISFRCAVCTSDGNIVNYFNTTDEVLDSYQLCNGIFEFTDQDVITVDMRTNRLNPSTTYYFIIWACSGIRYLYNKISGHSVRVYYFDSNVVYIDNGTELVPYECYIDSGASWDLYVPYIDNGTTWDICN